MSIKIYKGDILLSLLIVLISVTPAIILANYSGEEDVSIVELEEDDEVSNNPGQSNTDTRKYYDLVKKYSDEYGVDENLMNAIMDCENYPRDRTKQSDIIYNFTKPELGIHKGEREYSFGLVQINLHYNPNITYEQATDAEFSIEFLAKHLSKGRASMWGCYTNGGYLDYL